jgi:putative ABC transport system permease protein
MLPLLWRKALRDFRRMGLRSWLSFGVLAAGVATYAGGFQAQSSIFHTRDYYYDTLKLADLEVTLAATDQSELPAWMLALARGDAEAVKEVGAKAGAMRFLARGAVELANRKPIMSLEIYLDPTRLPTVDALELTDGRFLVPGRLDEVVMEEAVARLLGFKVGDSITLNPYNNPEPMRIVGLARTAEFLLPTANPDVLLPSKGSLVVVYRSIEKFTETFGEPMVNNLILAFDGHGVSEEEKRRVLDAVAPLRVKVLVAREGHFSYRFLEQDLKSFGIFVPVVAGIFGLVTLLVLLLSLARLMNEEQRETGALLAIGRTPRQVITAYLVAAFVYGSVAAVIGALCSPLVSLWLANAYADAIGLPPARLTIDVAIIARAAFLGVLGALTAVALPSLRFVRLAPAKAMRGSADTSFVKSPQTLEALLRPLGHSIALRFGIRNSLRRAKLTLAVVTLIAVAMAMSLAFRFCRTAWDEYAKMAFSHERWDAIVAFKTALKPAEAEPIFATAGVVEVEPMVSGFVEVCDTADSGCIDYRIVGMHAADRLRSFRFVQGALFATDDEPSIVMNNNFNHTRPYKIGEEIWVKDGERREKVRVVGLIDDMTIGLGYVPMGIARRVMNIPEAFTSFMARVEGDPRTVEKALFAHEMVTYVSLKVEMHALVLQYLEIIWSIIESAMLVSMVLAALFMLTGLSMVILEREGEYATLRTYGFSMGDLSRMIYVEVAAEAMLAVALALPLSMLLGRYLQYEIARAWFDITFYYFRPADLLQILLPCLLALPLAALPPILQVSRVPPARALRARGIG